LSVGYGGSYGCLKVWSDPDKQNLIIPNGDPPRYYARWSPAELPPLLYVEGFDVTLVWDAWLWLYYDAPDWGWVYPWDEADFTVVEVDVDMDGVKDCFYQWPGVTEEIIPGGFIALNDDDDNNNGIPDNDPADHPVTGEDDLVKITLRKVSPTNLSGNVTLKKVPSDSTKIKIWENETKGGNPVILPATYSTPSALPEYLWVEGVETSLTPRDITLALEYSMGGKTFEDKINVTVVEVEVIAAPEYLFASADYATPISFQVLGLGGEVHIHDIQAKLYLNGNLAKTIPIGQRFVASDPTIPSSGFHQENGTTYKYTGYVRASEYSTISLGDAHRTDDAYFILRVLASEVMPLGQLGPAVWVDSSLNDEKMDIFVDKDIFAVEPGIPGIHTAGAREYTNVPINSGTQTAVHKEGKKSMQHWEIVTPEVLPGTCCDTSEIHEHDYCGYGVYPTYPPFYVDIYEIPCWFWNDCPQDITTSSSQMSLYTRLYSTGGVCGNGFKNRIYVRRRGGYSYMSYGGKALASGILDSGEYAMDLSKTSGNFDWEMFTTGKVRFTNKQDNSGGLNAGAVSGSFGIAAALAAPISIPWTVAFGTLSGIFGIIEAVDTDSGAIDKKAEGVLYRCLVRHRLGFDPVTEKDVLLRDYDGSGSWIAADCSKVGKSINVGDQYTFFAEIESVCSAKTRSFFNVDVSQKTEYKCNTSDDFNYMRILISE